jgi:hypothetical protein
MESEIIFRMLLSLGAVFVAMYLILKIIQKYTKFGLGNKSNTKTGGLKIENIVYIDDMNKIVSLSNKNGLNYLVAFGKNNSFLIDKYKANEEE